MSELIAITEQNGIQTVSARSLHIFFENTDNVNTWLKRQVEKAMLVENEDFTRVAISQTSGQTSYDYALTISSAKEISMLNGGVKGKEARTYFLECEKQLKSKVFEIPQSYREALLLAADQQLVIEEQQSKIKILEPRSLYFDKIIRTDGLVTMEECAKLLNVPNIGRNKLYQKLREGNVVMKNSTTPYQHFVSKGYFELKEEMIEISKNGSMIRKVNITTMVTQKGLAFVFKFFGLTEKIA